MADREKLRKSLDRISSEVDAHFEAVRNEIVSATDDEIVRTTEKRRKTIAEINAEAEREIQRICDKRDQKRQHCFFESEETCRKIEQTKKALLKKLHHFDIKLHAYIEKLKGKYHGSHASEVNANIAKMVTDVPSNGQTVHDESQLINNGNFDGNDVPDAAIKTIFGVMRGVAFERVEGEKVGKIHGHKERWVLEHKIKMDSISIPVLRGTAGENEVVVSDGKTKNLYVTNIDTKISRRVLDDKTQLFNCASQDGRILVCGRKNGQVDVYDEDWKFLRKLTLPTSIQTGCGAVCVAIDNDGCILTAPYGGNNIHFYHPSGVRWLRTINIDAMIPIHGIHILRSGIAVHSAMFGEQVCVVDKMGATKATEFLEESEDKCLSVLTASRGTDTMFHLYCDSSRGWCVVEELQDISSGKVVIEKALEFPAPRLANGLIGAEGFSVLKSGKMVTCDGEQLLVFSKQRGIDCLADISDLL
ncbi:uncharacterized protein [Diadema antillarum]|uniref:uncharacterized protein n=1 Tax=Diadema antillarum TaxID=105358 RepID=UPI003A867073